MATDQNNARTSNEAATKQLIETCIGNHINNGELSRNQRWQVAKVVAQITGIVSAVMFPILALLVGAAYFFLKSVAEDTSRDLTSARISSIEIPPGAIVAFDLENGCPKVGWATYSSADGRMIVGTLRDSDEVHQSLVPLEFKVAGGSAAHQLTNDELPFHTHSYRAPQNSRRVASGDGADGFILGERETSSSGNNLAHNNMPPYLPLRYCIKIGEQQE